MSEATSDTATKKRPFEYAGHLVCAVNVADLGKALDWYRDMLGFETVYRLDDYGWAEIETPVPGPVDRARTGRGRRRPGRDHADIPRRRHRRRARPP